MRRTLTLMFVAYGWVASALAAPVGTGFTYQGQLKQGGVPVSETCDFEFTLWDDPVATLLTNQVGPTLIFDGGVGNSPPIAVVNGLFTVALDFGSNAFSGEARWLQWEDGVLATFVPPAIGQTVRLKPSPPSFSR